MSEQRSRAHQETEKSLPVHGTTSWSSTALPALFRTLLAAWRAFENGMLHGKTCGQVNQVEFRLSPGSHRAGSTQKDLATLKKRDGVLTFNDAIEISSEITQSPLNSNRKCLPSCCKISPKFAVSASASDFARKFRYPPPLIPANQNNQHKPSTKKRGRALGTASSTFMCSFSLSLQWL